MVKEIILIILLFNGEALSYHTWEYIPGDPMSHGWFLKDGTGTFQGFICK